MTAHCRSTVSREGKAGGRKPEMHGHEKSDRSVVPGKSRNKAGRPGGRAAADEMEGRGLAKGNPRGPNALRTQSRVGVGNGLDRIREAARRDRKARFTALLHHVTIDRLRGVYLAMNRRAAAGVDGVTWRCYGEELERNLQALHRRLHCGRYRVKPSRRVFIPKTDGRMRPLGIAALEDKLVQGAVLEVLNAVYEADFAGFSYGFRPGRNQHHALDALAVGILRKKVNWVLDADIRDFFGSISHEWLVRFVEHRIADRRVLGLVHRWLAAGVVEAGTWTRSEEGTPQGATISPLLANIYLHYVFDLWFHQWRRRYAGGDVIAVRYADDFVVGFEHQRDAERFLAELQARLGAFCLELAPNKTRLIEFGRYARARRRERGLGKPESFTFLGLRHVCHGWGGDFQLLRRTDGKRLRAKLSQVRAELMQRRHHSTVEQGMWLRSVVRGYYAYHAVPTNIRALGAFRTGVARAWLAALRRRSDKDRTTWEVMKPRIDRWLPRPRILHPWPKQRFDVTTRGRSRMR
jgi:group II intron reverse transcriptase/maturase